MKDSEYREVFSRNLQKYMSLSEKSQIDLINDLHLDKSTVSTWVNGTRLPRMDKVQMLADYFGIKKSDLIEDKAAAAPPAPAADPVLSDRDIALLEKYHSLNSLGMDKLDERADELCEMEKYKKDTANSVKAG